MTSKCTQSAPAASTLSTSSPSFAKFAERIDGAMTLGCLAMAGWLSGVGCRNRESGIGNRESGIGNRESGVGNREAGIGNRQSGIGKSVPHLFVASNPLGLLAAELRRIRRTPTTGNQQPLTEAPLR